VNQKNQQPNNSIKVKYTIDPTSKPAIDLNSKEFLKQVNDEIKIISTPKPSSKK
jgi:hypothetical protein